MKDFAVVYLALLSLSLLALVVHMHRRWGRALEGWGRALEGWKVEEERERGSRHDAALPAQDLTSPRPDQPSRPAPSACKHRGRGERRKEL